MVTVSVIIPTYNRASMVTRAINSALDQTLQDIEVIVVDDVSTDETSESVQAIDDSRLEYIEHETNRGGAAARNTGLDRASGDYVAFLDDDDKFLPGKLEAQMAELESRPDEWVATFCEYEMHETGFSQYLRKPVADRIGLRDQREGGAELIPLVLTNNLDYGGSSTLLVDRETVDSIGGFDPAFPRHQDREFVTRLLQHGKLAFVDETLVRRYDTGEMPPEDYEEGSRLLLSKFGELIDGFDDYDVEAVHRFDIARHHIKHGQFRRGVRFLPGSQIQISGLSWAALTGIPAAVRRVVPD